LGAKLLGDHLVVGINEVSIGPVVDGRFYLPGLGRFDWITVARPSGYLSVAAAWAVGDPIAFAVLVLLVMHTLNFSPIAFGRAIVGVLGCIVAGGIAGAIVHSGLGELGPWSRLGITAAVVAIVTGTLLAYTQGLSLRTARRALK